LQLEVVTEWVGSWDSIVDLLDDSWTSFSRTEKSVAKAFSKTTKSSVATLELYYAKTEEHLAILMFALMSCAYLRRIQEIILEWGQDWITDECWSNTISTQEEIEARLVSLLQPLHNVYGKSGDAAQRQVLAMLNEEYDIDDEVIDSMSSLFSALERATR
jgi:hypothetical protein